jgi:hypothetical protein
MQPDDINEENLERLEALRKRLDDASQQLLDGAMGSARSPEERDLMVRWLEHFFSLPEGRQLAVLP